MEAAAICFFPALERQAEGAAQLILDSILPLAPMVSMLFSLRGHDVIKAIKSFFQSGRLLKELNATAIALVPKVPNPDKWKDFRPISCCNTVYKCIAKIVANRLKVVLPNLVGPQQTAFIQGRRIGDNILLAQELLINYHRDKGSPRCALKVDLMNLIEFAGTSFLGFSGPVVSLMLLLSGSWNVSRRPAFPSLLMGN